MLRQSANRDATDFWIAVGYTLAEMGVEHQSSTVVPSMPIMHAQPHIPYDSSVATTTTMMPPQPEQPQPPPPIPPVLPQALAVQPPTSISLPAPQPLQHQQAPPPHLFANPRQPFTPNQAPSGAIQQPQVLSHNHNNNPYNPSLPAPFPPTMSYGGTPPSMPASSFATAAIAQTAAHPAGMVAPPPLVVPVPNLVTAAPRPIPMAMAVPMSGVPQAVPQQQQPQQRPPLPPHQQAIRSVAQRLRGSSLEDEQAQLNEEELLGMLWVAE